MNKTMKKYALRTARRRQRTHMPGPTRPMRRRTARRPPGTGNGRAENRRAPVPEPARRARGVHSGRAARPAPCQAARPQIDMTPR